MRGTVHTQSDGMIVRAWAYAESMRTYIPFALRIGATFLAAAVPLWINDGSWKDILGYGLLAALGYAGFGAASSTLEPSVGRKAEP